MWCICVVGLDCRNNRRRVGIFCGCDSGREAEGEGEVLFGVCVCVCVLM